MINEPPGGPDPVDPAGMDAIDRRMIRSSAWITIGTGGGQLIGMLSTLVLARLLEPQEFGIVAVGYILIAIVGHLQESGVSSALVHLQENVEQMASSAFVFTALSGVFFATLVGVGAPLYTRLVGAPEATQIVRALGLVLILRGLSVVPAALLEREMNFRSRVRGEGAGYVLQAGVAIGCAIGGLGAWSLVAGQLSAAFGMLVVYWILVPWRPQLRSASVAAVRPMLRYGRSISAANVVDIANTSIDRIAISRFAGTGALGSYSIAWRMAEIPNLVISPTIGRPIFSAVSQLQHDLGAIRRIYLQAVERIMILALPATIALILAADPIVPVLLGERWEDAVPLLRILAIYGLVRLIIAPSGEVFRGIGRPGLLFRGTVFYFAVAAVSLLLLAPSYGAPGAALAVLAAVTATSMVFLPKTIEVLGLKPTDLPRALARPVLCSAPLAAGILIVTSLDQTMSQVVQLATIGVAGTIIYAVTVAVGARSVLLPIVSALRRPRL